MVNVGIEDSVGFGADKSTVNTFFSIVNFGEAAFSVLGGASGFLEFGILEDHVTSSSFRASTDTLIGGDAFESTIFWKFYHKYNT